MGFRLARAAYIAAVQPAAPDPNIKTFVLYVFVDIEFIATFCFKYYFKFKAGRYTQPGVHPTMHTAHT